MPDKSLICPACKSKETRYRERRRHWFCDHCDHIWTTGESASSEPVNVPPQTCVFISYGRRDSSQLAARIAEDLRKSGYQVWIDTSAIRPGESWQHEITAGLKSSRLVVALLSPHSVRSRDDGTAGEGPDSVCLSEIALALFGNPRKPVIPVMGLPCEPPLSIYHFDYIDLTHWSESESLYRAGIERLLTYLGEMLADRPPRYRNWFHFLQPWDFAAFLHEKRKGFTGREWLFKEIDEWRSKATGSRFLLITGDPGIGKSAIVAHLVHHNASGQVVAYHCCQADTRATLEPWRFVRSIAAMLASRFVDYARQVDSPAIREILGEEKCRQDPGSALERGILAPLAGISPPSDGVRYLLIDALDESLAGNISGNIVDMLASRADRFPDWLRIVATTRKEPAVLRRFKGKPTREIQADDPSNIEDLRRYIHDIMASPEFSSLVRENIANSADGEGLHEIASALAEKSCGNFLYVKQALSGLSEALREKRLASLSIGDILAMPQGLAGMYEQFFHAKFGNNMVLFSQVRGLLEVVCAAKEPLCARDLAPASGFLSNADFAEAWRMVAQFLPERVNPGKDSVYRPFHKSLVDWLTSTTTMMDSEFGVEVMKGHQRLAEAGWNRYLTSPESMGPYFLRYLPHHLSKVQAAERLSPLLADFGYIRLLVEAGLVFDLVRHYIEALPLLSQELRNRLEPWFFFLRANSGSLAANPDSFFQTAFNEPTNSPVALATEAAWKSANSTRRSLSGRNNSVPSTLYERLTRPAQWERPACLLTLSGHDDFVSAVATDTAGQLVASGSDDKTIKIWDADTGECQITCCGHTGKVFAAAVSMDGSLVASGSEDRKVIIWDSETGQPTAILEGHDGYVLGVAISPDNQTVYSCSEDSTIRVWTPASLTCTKVINAHKDRVICLRLSQGGERLLSGSSDRTIALWDTTTGAELLRIREHRAVVFGVAISPTCSRIASVSQDGTLRVWDSENGKCMCEIHCSSDYFYDVDYSPDGRFLVTAAHGGDVEIWNPSTGGRVSCLRGHSAHAVSVAWRKNLVITGARDTKIKVWDTDSGGQGELARGQTATPMALALLGGKGPLAAGMTDETIKFWDIEKGVFIRSTQAHRSYVLTLSSPEKTSMLVSGSYDEMVKTWSPPFESPCQSLAANLGYVFSVSTSASGKKLAAGYSQGYTRLWDGATGECLGTLNGHRDAVLAVALDPEGQRCITGSRDGTVRIWNLDNLLCLAELGHHGAEVRTVAISPDGNLAASGGGDHRVWLFNPHTGSDSHFLAGHSEVVTCLAFLNEGLLASGSSDSTVRIWDTRNRQLLKTLEAHAGEVTSLVADKSGAVLISSYSDGTIRSWKGPVWIAGSSWFGNPNKVERFTWSSADSRGWILRQDGTRLVFSISHVGSRFVASPIETDLTSGGSPIDPYFTSTRGKGVHYPDQDHKGSIITGRFIQAYDLLGTGKLVACIPENGGIELFARRELESAY